MDQGMAFMYKILLQLSAVLISMLYGSVQVIDIYFGGSRKTEHALRWIKEHWEKKKGHPGVKDTPAGEIAKMADVLGRAFTTEKHRPVGYAFLIKLAGRFCI